MQIPPQVVDLLRTGVSVIVGTRDAGLMPESTRAWGIRVAPDYKTSRFFSRKPFPVKRWKTSATTD